MANNKIREKAYLHLTTRSIVLLVTFVTALIAGTYLFATYMYTKSEARFGGAYSGAYQGKGFSSGGWNVRESGTYFGNEYATGPGENFGGASDSIATWDDTNNNGLWDPGEPYTTGKNYTEAKLNLDKKMGKNTGGGGRRDRF